MADWAAWAAVAMGAFASLASLYARAVTAEHSKEIAVLQSELAAAVKSVHENYGYCHDVNHKANGHLANHDARLRLMEYKLKMQSE